MQMSPADTRAEQLLDQAEDALGRGDAGVAFELCERILRASPGHAGATFIQAEACRDLGDIERAATLYEEVVRANPGHALSWAGLAWARFELILLDEAYTAVSRALQISPRLPEAHYLRAVLRERRGDDDGAKRDYVRAARIEPEHYPLPLELSHALVDAIVEEVLLSLHPSVRAYLSQVSILLEEFPEEDLCLKYDPPASPSELLGYYTGTSLRERSMSDPWSNLPSAIVLFRRNIARVAMDRDRMMEELRVTVFHEVGHFLGLSEADLAARGLD